VVVENDIAWRVDTMVDYLFGRPVMITSAAWSRRREGFCAGRQPVGSSIGIERRKVMCGIPPCGRYSFSAIATSRTNHLLAAHTPPPDALTAGFQRALLVSALCLLAAGAIALRASNTRGEPAATPEPLQTLEPSYDPA